MSNYSWQISKNARVNFADLGNNEFVIVAEQREEGNTSFFGYDEVDRIYITGSRMLGLKEAKDMIEKFTVDNHADTVGKINLIKHLRLLGQAVPAYFSPKEEIKPEVCVPEISIWQRTTNVHGEQPITISIVSVDDKVQSIKMRIESLEIELSKWGYSFRVGESFRLPYGDEEDWTKIY
jgi:hypothetical protein